MGLLDGVTVVEWGRAVSAPYCGKLFADLGADVVKVEPPEGEPCRREPPFPDDLPDPERSGLFGYLNTSKRGITLDLTSAAGRQILAQLLARADVFVENQPRGLVRRWELDEAHLRRWAPDLIVVSISPFGRTGPNRNAKGTDLTAWAAGGFSHLTPRFAADSANPPLKMGTRQAEFLAGANAATGALCALLVRPALGSGQDVDVSEQEAVASVLHGAVPAWSYRHQVSGRVAQHMGAPNEAYPCADGYIHIQCTEEHQWHRFVDLMGTPEWATLPVFATSRDRGANFDAFSPLVAEWTRPQTKDQIMDRAAAARLPFAPLLTMAEVAADPQVRHRAALIEVTMDDGRDATLPGAPYKLTDPVAADQSGGRRDATPAWSLRPAPRLGQHNVEVLRELGYQAPEILRLRHAGAI